MATCMCGMILATNSQRSLCEDCRRYIGYHRKKSAGELRDFRKRKELQAKRLGVVPEVPKTGAIEPRASGKTDQVTKNGTVIDIKTRRKVAT